MDTTTTINPTLLLEEKTLYSRLADFRSELLIKVEVGEVSPDTALYIGDLMMNFPLEDPTIPSATDEQIKEAFSPVVLEFDRHPEVDSINLKLDDYRTRTAIVLKEGKEMDLNLRNPATRNILAGQHLEGFIEHLKMARDVATAGGVDPALVIPDHIVNGAQRQAVLQSFGMAETPEGEEKRFIIDIVDKGIPIYSNGLLIKQSIREMYMMPNTRKA